MLLRCCSCFIAFPFVWSFANHFRARACCFFSCFVRLVDESPVCIHVGCTFCDYIRDLLHYCMVRISIFPSTFPNVARKHSFLFHHTPQLQVRIDSLFGYCCSMKFFLLTVSRRNQILLHTRPMCRLPLEYYLPDHGKLLRRTTRFVLQHLPA